MASYVGSVTIGDYNYSLYDDRTARARVIDDTKASYGALRSSVTYSGVTYRLTSLYDCFLYCYSLTTAPTIPDGVTAMNRCFYGCVELTTAPEIPEGVTNLYQCFYQCSSLTTVTNIPSTVTSLGECFRMCSALTGTIRVAGAPTYYPNCFTGTTLPIVLDATRTAALSTWQAVAATSSGNVTVTYPTDNPAPTGTITATRVASAGSTTSDESGRYVYVQVATAVSTEKAPYNVAQAPTITVDGNTVTPTQTSGTASWHGWVALSDDYAHTIGATPNDLYKSGITVTATLPSTYSPMEFHATGDGASFGKHATRSGVLDVAWDIENEGTITSGGDITSGGEFRVDAAFDSNASSVPTRSYRDLFKSFDNQGIQYSTVLSWKEVDGRDGLGLVLHRVVNGADKFSQLGVMMKNDGTVRYLASNPGALAMAAQPDITLTTNGDWEHGCRPYGDYFRVDIPCAAAPQSVTCTNAGMFVNGKGWVNINYRNYTHRLNMIHLYFDQVSDMTEGKVFVVRMNLTVRFEHM